MMEGPSAESEEKREPASDIDTGVVDSLKVLDPDRPIREADIDLIKIPQCSGLLSADSGTPETLARCVRWRGIVSMPNDETPRERYRRLAGECLAVVKTMNRAALWKCIKSGIFSRSPRS